MTDEILRKAKELKNDIDTLSKSTLSSSVSSDTYNWWNDTMIEKINELKKEYEDL